MFFSIHEYDYVHDEHPGSASTSIPEMKCIKVDKSRKQNTVLSLLLFMGFKYPKAVGSIILEHEN